MAKPRTVEQKAAKAAYMRDYWKQNPDKYAAMLARQCRNKNSTKTYQRNKDKPEFKDKKRAADKRYAASAQTKPNWTERITRKRNADGARHYKMCPNEYARRKEANCDICGIHVPRGKQGGGMHIDHDHETGQIRGTLCRNCNTAIGVLGDSVERVEAAAAYLRHWKEKAQATA